MKRKKAVWAGVILVAAGLFIFGGLKLKEILTEKKPDKLIVEYMKHIEKKEYGAMYAMLEPESVTDIGKEGFIDRNSRIYEGIEIQKLKVANVKMKKAGKKSTEVAYESYFNTAAGKVSFQNKAEFTKTEKGWRLLWKDSLIFPDLTEKDKVRISIQEAERGQILDRNGKVLAGRGVASSVGIVPGVLENREENLPKLAEILGMDVETIEKKLSAQWVKEDSFVPIATVRKITELDLTKLVPDPEVLAEQARQEELLSIQGVTMTDVEVRTYSMGKAASHLIGYVQSVTAEDLEEHAGEGYSANSVIGRSGMEGLYEKELKGQDGCIISIVDETGTIKKVLASVVKEDGQDIRLTIDASLQQSLYDQFQEVKGCSVAMNPYTGEVLALVSTPSFDNNDFIKGMSQEQWNLLNDDPEKPMYNRFRQAWCPGSTFKPVVAAVGLKTGALNPQEDYGASGRSWQKDDSWGGYYVTTLQEYTPAVLKNALIYSDNIYFAKAALKIGADSLMSSLDDLGFNQKIPFEITMTPSQYSNTEKIETEIQLADSGYGQGEVLTNPLHLADIYTAFLNNGDILKPYLLYKDQAEGEVWIPGAFAPEQIQPVMEGMTGVINDPAGTGYKAHRDDVLLAGKTGTAELKATKEDTTGTEIGWLSVFTAEKNVPKPILLVSMVENVKGIGGCSYVIQRDKNVLDIYFQ